MWMFSLQFRSDIAVDDAIRDLEVASSTLLGMRSLVAEALGTGGDVLRVLSSYLREIRDNVGVAVKEALVYSQSRVAITLPYINTASIGNYLASLQLSSTTTSLCRQEALLVRMRSAMNVVLMDLKKAVDELVRSKAYIVERGLLHATTDYPVNTAEWDAELQKDKFLLYVLKDDPKTPNVYSVRASGTVAQHCFACCA
jgi:hypothetical protein